MHEGHSLSASSPPSPTLLEPPGLPLITCLSHMSYLNSTWLQGVCGRWELLAGILGVGSEVHVVHPSILLRGPFTGQSTHQTAVHHLHFLQRDLALGP